MPADGDPARTAGWLPLASMLLLLPTAWFPTGRGVALPAVPAAESPWRGVAVAAAWMARYSRGVPRLALARTGDGLRCCGGVTGRVQRSSPPVLRRGRCLPRRGEPRTGLPPPPDAAPPPAPDLRGLLRRGGDRDADGRLCGRPPGLATSRALGDDGDR